MHAVREFWAKSLLNKLLMVTLAGMVCCCPLALVGVGGGNGVATGATATPAPTGLAAPTAGSAATPAPTSTTMPAASAAPAETALVTAYASGGLGLSRAAWEERRGKPTKESAAVFFYGPRLSVLYYDGLVWNITYAFGEPGVPLAEARDAARLLLPQDSALIETYSSLGRLVDRYRSPSLAPRCSNANWINGEPGDHIVIYKRLEESNLVFAIVISLGNNP